MGRAAPGCAGGLAGRADTGRVDHGIGQQPVGDALDLVAREAGGEQRAASQAHGGDRIDAELAHRGQGVRALGVVESRRAEDLDTPGSGQGRCGGGHGAGSRGQRRGASVAREQKGAS